MKMTLVKSLQYENFILDPLDPVFFPIPHLGSKSKEVKKAPDPGSATLGGRGAGWVSIEAKNVLGGGGVREARIHGLY